VEYFNYLGNLIINDAKGTRENYIQVCHGKSSFQQADSFHLQIELKLKEENSKFCAWSIALCGAETWTLRKVDQEYQKV